jgi:hypothetical protein
MTKTTALEKHYTPGELAELWGLSVRTIRRMFQDCPGVFVIGEKMKRRGRGHTTIRIPSSVAEQVYAQRQNRAR